MRSPVWKRKKATLLLIMVDTPTQTHQQCPDRWSQGRTEGCRIEFGSNYFSSLFTTPVHPITLDSGLFTSPYQIVDPKHLHFFVSPLNNPGTNE